MQNYALTKLSYDFFIIFLKEGKQLMSSTSRVSKYFYDIRVAERCRADYQQSKSAFEQGKLEGMPQWQRTFFNRGADYFLKRLPISQCTPLPRDCDDFLHIPEISEEERALMVFARVHYDSQSIIERLTDKETSGHFFCSESEPQPQYIFNYSLLLEALVIPAVFNAFEAHNVHCERECIQSSFGHTMTQLKFTKTLKPSSIKKAKKPACKREMHGFSNSFSSKVRK
ncbi:hypothetical protein [Simkania sp.]|uniref:hypothetical protein n=1 Tax=Simkania sp. TaxID=34094 RepID=UPI003B516659